MEGKEKEAHDYFVAFVNNIHRVTAAAVGKALPAAPSWVLPCLLPARGLLEGCCLCRAAPLPAPCAITTAPRAPGSCQPCLCPLTLPLCLSSPRLSGKGLKGEVSGIHLHALQRLDAEPVPAQLQFSAFSGGENGGEGNPRGAEGGG